MVKRCQWGLCKSDSRYPERLVGGVEFIPFPKPKRNLEKCKRWIKACGRPHEQLNISVVDGNYHLYVCTKHFQEGKPSDTYPDPIHADVVGVGNKYTPARRPPKRRPDSEPPAPRKRRNVLLEINASAAENTHPVEAVSYSVQTDSVQPVVYALQKDGEHTLLSYRINLVLYHMFHISLILNDLTN